MEDLEVPGKVVQLGSAQTESIWLTSIAGVSLRRLGLLANRRIRMAWPFLHWQNATDPQHGDCSSKPIPVCFGFRTRWIISSKVPSPDWINILIKQKKFRTPMRFDVVRIDLAGRILEQIREPQPVLENVLTICDSAGYPFLTSIDPYGDTIFNVCQIDRFIAEWKQLKVRLPTENAREFFDRVEAMADNVKREAHTYLKFIGG